MTDPASLAARILLSLTLAVAASTAACANVIVGGAGSSDGGGSTSGTPTTSGSGITTSPYAIATPYKYLYDTEGGNGAGYTDENLVLEFGNEVRSCTSPPGNFACGTWSLSISLQPAFQHPGTFPIQYGDDTVQGFFTELGPGTGGRDSCWTSGGPLGGTTVTILEIDATHVAFTIQGFDDFIENFTVDGTYDAPRCWL